MILLAEIIIGILGTIGFISMLIFLFSKNKQRSINAMGVLFSMVTLILFICLFIVVSVSRGA